MKKSSQLVNALIAKSILDTILVGTIAVAVYMNAFPPSFRGWGEAVIETQTIAGWVVNASEPWQRVEVELFIDGQRVATQVAQHSRPDVSAAGWAKDEWHGYNFVVPRISCGHARSEGVRASSKPKWFALHVAVVRRSNPV